MATRCLILYNYLRWGGYKIVVELPDDIYHLYSFWGTIKIIIVREGFIGNNLFSLGGLIDWNPSASPRDLINNHLCFIDYFPINPSLTMIISIVKLRFDLLKTMCEIIFEMKQDNWNLYLKSIKCSFFQNYTSACISFSWLDDMKHIKCRSKCICEIS